MDAAESDKLAIPQQRSPAFPYVSLDVALDRVKRIYAAVREHAQPREVIARAYGKPATSSATIQTFATLLQYGLLENVTTQTGRKMRVTPLAQSILSPHAPEAKLQEGHKLAALNPSVFKELWSRFGDTDGLNDSVPLYYLTKERGHEHSGLFTDKAARDVLRVYRATLSFAGISGSANNQNPADGAADTLPPEDIKVGDFVQAEINGQIQFKQPKRVEVIEEHEGKFWIFVEGEKAAVEMSQVTLQPEPQNAGNPAVPPTRKLPETFDNELPEGWVEERLIDDGGDEIKIRYRGRATQERYEFIRDYLDFKIKRLSKKDG